MGAAAVIAGVGAAASIGGSLLSSSAASSAADKQVGAADRASQAAQAQFAQTRQDLAPYRDFGQNALGIFSGIFGQQRPAIGPSTTTTTTGNPLSVGGGLGQGLSIIPNPSASENAGSQYWLVDQSGNVVQQAATPGELQAAMGSGGGGTTTTTTNPGSPGGYGASGGNILTANGLRGLTFQPTQAELEATPGYQFIKNEGQQGVANSNAAQGRGISGSALKGAAKFAEGLAGTTLGQQQQIFQANLGNIINPLEWAANLGQTAATQTGQQGLAATQNANALSVGGANAAASGIVGSSNALAGGLNTLGGAPSNYMLYSQLLNKDSGGGLGSGGYY